MEKEIDKNICPVCGFILWFEPWKDDSPSQEICPSCGIQFGYDDMAGGEVTQRGVIYKNWRQKWISTGMKWWSRNEAYKPNNWDPKKQLENLNI